MEGEREGVDQRQGQVKGIIFRLLGTGDLAWHRTAHPTSTFSGSLSQMGQIITLSPQGPSGSRAGGWRPYLISIKHKITHLFWFVRETPFLSLSLTAAAHKTRAKHVISRKHPARESALSEALLSDWRLLQISEKRRCHYCQCGNWDGPNPIIICHCLSWPLTGEAHTGFAEQFQRKRAPDHPSLLCHNINQIKAKKESARARNLIRRYEIK